MIDLRLGDCLEVMPTLPAGSIDAIITDLPYFEIAPHDWDNQWKNRDQYIEWVLQLATQWKRLAKDNGSIFIFCDEKTEAYLQVRLDERFLLLNKIVWYKVNNLPIKNAHLLRTFAPMTERALFYTTQYDATGWKSVKLDVNNFIPLRKYFQEFQEALGLSIKQVNACLGHRKAEHAFYWNSTQWDLPTREVYLELCNLKPNGFKIRDYESLRRDYESLRRIFNADCKTLDVIEWPIINNAENTAHPTTKPIGLMKRIVSVITEKGSTVLDCCMGSGTTGVACARTGRNFIGIEREPEYFQIAQRRIAEAQAQPILI
jgi:DNA modification methylase